MKNKKFLIIVLFIVLFISIILVVIKPFDDSKKFDEIGKNELIEHLKSIEDKSERENEIQKAIEKDWITQEIANTIR